MRRPPQYVLCIVYALGYGNTSKNNVWCLPAVSGVINLRVPLTRKHTRKNTPTHRLLASTRVKSTPTLTHLAFTLLGDCIGTNSIPELGRGVCMDGLNL